MGVRFRGRELAHTELGKVVLDKILDELTRNNVSYILERSAKMEGRMMSITVAPGKGTASVGKTTDAEDVVFDSEGSTN